MLRFWTTKNGQSLAAACLGLSICSCSGEVSDPRSLPTDAPSPQHLAATPQVATGHVYGAPLTAPSAPLAQQQRRVAARQVTPVFEVAVGSGASTAIHQDFVQAFAPADGALRCRGQSCSDREAIDRVKVGRADAALVSGSLCGRDLQAGLREVRLGVELFALFVAPSAGVESLNPSQIRRIFTGQVKDWRELGFAPGEITPVVPADRGARARAARVMIPGDRLWAGCTPVSSLEQLVEQWETLPGAVALMRVPRGGATPKVRGVQIDRVSPSLAAFGVGSYPYGVPLQLVSMGAPTGPVTELLAFSRSVAGRAKLSRLLTTGP